MSNELNNLFDVFYLDDDNQKRYHMSQLQQDIRKITPKTIRGKINHFLHSDILKDYLIRKLYNRVDTLDNDKFINVNLCSIVTNDVVSDYHTKCIEEKDVSIQAIDSYIVSLPTFEKKVKEQIIDLWKELKEYEPEDIDIRYLFLTLKSRNDIYEFSSSIMKRIITEFEAEDNTLRIHETLLHNTTTNDDDAIINDDDRTNTFLEISKTNEDNVIIFKHYREHYDRTPSFEEVEIVKTKLQNKSLLVDIIVNHQNLFNSFHLTNLNEGFYDVFERDITVFELQKYYAFSLKWIDTTKETCVTYFTSIKEKFVQAVDTTIHLYKLYTRQVVNQLFVIKNHINIFDEEHFEQVLKEYLVNLPQYKTYMLEKLTILHNKQFVTDVSENDLQYYYQQICQHKIHLESDELITLLSSMYQKTQTLTNTINTIFQDTLQRDADIFEHVAYINKLRENEYTDSINNTNDNDILLDLENELLTSLEYINILKLKIININNQLYPSQLNTILHTIMSSKNSIQIKKDNELLKQYIYDFNS